MKNGYNIGAFISYCVSIVFIWIGFHKMFAYENSDDIFSDKVNAYVGGDAYNYIINSNYATAYFTLATLFVILGGFLMVMGYLASKDIKDKKVFVNSEEFKNDNPM
jgi:hypothetical protein